MSVADSTIASALREFRAAGGTLRASEARARGVHPRTLRHLEEAGAIDKVSRGVYRLAEAEPTRYDDLVIVAKRAPKAVVTLLTAFDVHDLTDEIPHAVYIALPRGIHAPRLDHPPLHTVHVSEPAYSAGIETHVIGGVDVSMYSAPRAVVDGFKFRSTIGVDVATDALKRYLQRSDRSLQDLHRHAETCNMTNVMQPYLEALM
ncbi:type IV toxin-antitoxin system AbiEi family antitoxin domain-containing protein [Salisaeta longa]|uniref:type IV toxin-antitoxin system AbiEi family antitoxin domain-containing protein n=1 Tax=Salisaeta longa TaxID=503170 RepID=UPI0003B3A47A|nr:type IV toxin-antitoxin system AbiEi family antitoxin domain-containing protein [Salisaeta longa]